MSEETLDETKMFYNGKLAQLFFKTDDKGNIVRFLPADLSKKIQQLYKIVTLKDNDEIYIYDNTKGIYEPNGAKTLREIVKQALDKLYLEKHATAVINDITACTYIEREDFKLPTHLIPVKNGLLDISKNPPDLLKHSSDYFITGVLPVKYNSKAECPRFLKFLEEVLPQMIPRLQLQEGVGNCLTPETNYMIIFFLFGGGHNGKTTFLKTIKTLLGSENVSRASLYDLAYGRWYTAELYRKFANIYADIGLKELKHTGKIKVLTGEDSVFGEKKFKSPFPFTNTAKPWFSGNMVPYVYDNSNAFFRRWNIVTFKEEFIKGSPKTDPDLIKKLTTPEELSGILNWSIEGYYRLRQQKNFTGLKSIEDRRIQWKELSDPLSAFIAIGVVSGDFITKKYFILSYKEYCKKNGVVARSKSFVGRRMKELGYEEGRMRKVEGGKQDYSWIGITVKNEYLVEAEEVKRQEGLDESFSE